MIVEILYHLGVEKKEGEMTTADINCPRAGAFVQVVPKAQAKEAISAPDQEIINGDLFSICSSCVHHRRCPDVNAV